MKMKADGRNRRKVVVRRLPPSLSPSQFFDQTDRLFSDRYNWASYRPGVISRKYQRCSRAYIEFKGPQDVLHFEELFDGHIFTNENGVQYKATVEYAPFQSVPKASAKDGREGTIFIDPEYLEFLKLIAEPFENQLSAEIQLEIKETDQTEEVPVVTSDMESVRKSRTADSGTQDLNGYRNVGNRATRSKPHSTSMKNSPNKEQNTPRDKSQSTNKKNLEKDHANPNLGEKTSLSKKAKESKILQKVHKPNTSNPSFTGDSTASQTPSKTAKVPGQGTNDRKPSKKQASANKVWVPKVGK